jgi:hypothetical protein
MEVSGQLHAPAALPPGERVSGTHWIGGWVGPRAVLDAVVKRKIPISRRESNPRTPIVQAVAQRSILIQSFHLPLGFSSGLVRSFFDKHFVYSSSLSHACYVSHRILLYLISLLIFNETYKLWSPSLCSLLQPPVYFSFRLWPACLAVVSGFMVEKRSMSAAVSLLGNRLVQKVITVRRHCRK